MKKLLIANLITASLFAAPIMADDVEDAANMAAKLYKQGDFAKAAAQWDYAATQARQKQAAQAANFLPDALKGWTLNDSENEGLAGSMFGGGSSVSRHYSKGEAEVNITMVSDNPMIQGVAMMFANPSIAAMSGIKQKIIKGQTALIQSEGNDKQLMFLMRNGRTLITIDASGSKDDSATATAYANAINFDAIEKM